MAITKQGDGKYSARVGNQKFNGLSRKEAQSRVDSNYQATPDSLTDSVNQKARNVAVGIKSGDSNMMRDSALSGRAIPVDILNTSVPTTSLPSPYQSKASDYASILTGAAASALPTPMAEGVEEAPVTPAPSNKLYELLGLAPKQESMADAYAKAEKQAGIQKKTEARNQYQNQLNTIINNSTAERLSLEGQGRGVTESIIGGQQAQIAKEAAIQALPVQAALAASQADLDTATAHLDKMFSIYQQDAQNEYNYKKELFGAVMNIASKEQERALMLADKASDRIYQEKQDNIKLGNSITNNAMINGASAAVLSAIAEEAKRPGATYGSIAGVAGRYGVDTSAMLDIQAKKASIANSYDSIRSRRAADALAAQEEASGFVGGLRSQPAYKGLETSQKVKADSLNNLIKNLNQYRVLYDQTVTDKAGSNIAGADSALLSSQVNSLMFAAAQAEGTGALQAADREVLEKVIPNPTTGGLFASIGRAIKGGKKGGLVTLDSQIAKYASNLSTYGLVPAYEAGTIIED